MRIYLFINHTVTSDLLSEEDPAGDVDPAMLGLQVLALGGAATARTPHHPDHGLQTLLHLGTTPCQWMIEWLIDLQSF